MKFSLLAMAPVMVLIPPMWGQGGTPQFTGPAVLTQGLGTVGQRSGGDVDLRFFVGATGVYDTGITAFALDEDGKLLRPDPLYGVETVWGAYGRHYFRRSFIGLDYSGNYRRYANSSSFGGTNHQLSAEYAIQVSRRWVLDFRGDAGTQVFGTAFGSSFPNTGSPVDSNNLLFDNRTSYLQGGLQATYLLSNRTSVTMGGSGYLIRRDAQTLPGVNGYTLTGAIQHQVSRDTFVGINYSHTGFSYPSLYGSSTNNTYMASITHKFARTLSVTIGGGAFMSSVVGTQNILLDPILAELLGIPFIPVAFERNNTFPMAQASVTKQFRRSSFSANASRMISAGNGLYLSSRQDSVGAGYAYTGFRRVGLSASVNWSKMGALAQQLPPFQQFNSTARLTYNLGHGFNLSGAYNFRHQDINTGPYLTNSSRVSFGIMYSPSNIPLSFH